MTPVAGGKVLYGKYAGTVFDNRDPKRLGRVRALVPEVGFAEAATDWAFPCVPFGSLNVPPDGSNVWVEFEAGNIDRPIWSGVFYSEPGGVSEVPGVARGVPDAAVAVSKGTDQALTGDGLTANEPPDPHGSSYPTARVVRSQSGHLFEVDDTPGQERVAVFHKIGSYLEAKRDGSITLKAVGRWHQIVGGNTVEHVLGQKIVVVETALNETVRGVLNRRVEGNVTERFTRKVSRVYDDAVVDHYEGELRQTVDGKLVQNVSGSIGQTSAGGLTQTVGGAHSRFVVGTSSEQVGNLLGSLVAKKTHVLAGNVETILASGAWSVSTSLGILLTSLLQVVAAAPSVRLGSALAAQPAVLGLLFQALYNGHTHPDPVSGVTGTPVVPMSAAQLSAKVFAE